ncbi:MAG: DUF554 domain-containing protein [Verrucomicrobia bacterium]|nr:DUF554 domain-containing protein [Verrucomicrobiota bacterium]
MTGTLVNAVAIVAGGIVGLATRKRLALGAQQKVKVLLGVFAIYAGLAAAWTSFHGALVDRLQQFALVLLALVLGKWTGHALKLQRGLNRLGQFAKRCLSAPPQAARARFNDAFAAGTVLFCLAPLAVAGALLDGLEGDIKPLAIKAVMDGLATLALARTLGWGLVLSALPVLVFQGTLSMGAMVAAAQFNGAVWGETVSATAGFLVAFVALVILEVKKVELADYLPSFGYAILLAWWLR